MRLRCNTCLGEYDDVLPDGLRYFHACPPVEEFFDATRTPITREQAHALLTAGGRYSHRFVPRPNARDENVVRGRGAARKGQPKAEGLGVMEIPPPDPFTAGLDPVLPAAAPSV